jgi:putative transposase
MDSVDNFLIERGLLSASNSEWECARLRTEVISMLAQLKIVTCELADNAAKKLGISRRQVYALIERYRQGKWLL